jgi:hypothetical protein
MALERSSQVAFSPKVLAIGSATSAKRIAFIALVVGIGSAS